MTADVNVTEKVARAEAKRREPLQWRESVEGRNGFIAGVMWYSERLADPDVLAGIAEALVQGGVLGCCVDCPTPHARSDREEQAREVAAAVVEWLRGRA